MARKKKEFRASAIAVDLFPFLSILCSLIGTLVLILVALTVSQVEETVTFGSISAPQAIIDAMDVNELVNLRVDDADLERRYKALQEEYSKVKDLLGPANAESEMVTEDGGRAASNSGSGASAAATPSAELVSKNQLPKVTIDPSGSGSMRKVKFIECTDRALIIQDNPPLRIFKVDIANSKKYKEALDKIRMEGEKRDQQLGLSSSFGVTADQAPGKGWDVIFLIRPDGVETFNLAAKVADDVQARYAYLPVPGYGPLDLSKFTGSEKK